MPETPHETVQRLVQSRFGGNYRLVSSSASSMTFELPRDWHKAGTRLANDLANCPFVEVVNTLPTLDGVPYPEHLSLRVTLKQLDAPRPTNHMQRNVRDFLIKHLGADDQGRPNKTGVFNKWLLIAEEFEELAQALGMVSVVGVDSSGPHIQWEDNDNIHLEGAIDAICDLLYVVFNLCEELDIDIQPFFDEVHRSNMTKTPGRLSPNKKILKGPDYSPADIAGVLAKQRRSRA